MTNMAIIRMKIAFYLSQTHFLTTYQTIRIAI